jgi:hypothetical protein
MDADRQAVLPHSKATQQRTGLETKQNSFWLFLAFFGFLFAFSSYSFAFSAQPSRPLRSKIPRSP